MRAKEFINEGGKRGTMRADALAAIPNMHFHPQADFYRMYRMGVASASMNDDPHPDHSPYGPTMNFPVTLGYTNVDKQMTKKASKYVGIKHSKITPDGSKETEDVHNVSPVSDWNKKSKKRTK